MKVEMMRTEDYDEVFGLMKEVFSKAHGREEDFEKNLPKMCHRDEEHMNKHIGIRENGRLTAVLGIYPLPVKIGGRELLFSTVGNVCVHPDYEGRGFMKEMMRVAMERLFEIGADASRLGGLRSRYNHYGYEACGSICRFTLTERNLMPYRGAEITFLPVSREDEEALCYCDWCYRKNAIAVDRFSDGGFDGIWYSLSAWQNETVLAVTENGERLGYLNVTPDHRTVSEFYVNEKSDILRVFAAWQEKAAETLTVSVFPYDIASLAAFSAVAEYSAVSSPNHFKIIRFDRVADALMQVKRGMTPLPEGEFVLGIEGFGNLKLYVRDGNCGAEKTEEDAAITLGPLEAERFLFGPLPPAAVACCDAFAMSILPLPLSWDLQDRV